MQIDCDQCTARGRGCGDCFVTVVLGEPPADIELDEADRAALRVLADSGLVAPPRLEQTAAIPADRDARRA